uniref:Splicing factor YJU2 n=1 Tax=Glossina morsitans morsitans TaxID=37546 RepID=A0A1B0FNH8_GLOMM
MSERKVLNKYYPPDFDPSKIPRMKLAKNRQYTVRLMAPFNMRCKTCGEYIYKGKKFNARKEDVENETYLNIRIYRFYIKCTRCLQEISFKTDPKNTDYEIEAGATRNFMALKLAEEQARREEEEAREEETNNPMKLLENRTQQSKNEIELLESLEELRDLNRRQETVDYDLMLKQYNGEDKIKRIMEMEAKEDEETIKSMRLKHKRLQGDTKILEETIESVETPAKMKKPNTKTKVETSTSHCSSRTQKHILSNIIKRKLPDENLSKPNMVGGLSLVNYSESSDDNSE